jgi:hypothetical protein
MKRERLKRLIKEFEQICGKEVAEDSASTALFISESFNYERSEELKLHFLNQLKREDQGTSTSRYFLVPLLLSILLIFSFVYKVEASVPGDMFYPVKEFSTLIQDNVKKAVDPSKDSSNTNITVQPSITETKKKVNKKSQEPAIKAIDTISASQRITPTLAENKNVNEIKGDLEKGVEETKEIVEEIIEKTELPVVTQVPQSLQNTLGL